MPLAFILTLSTISIVSTKGYRIASTLYATELGAGPLIVGVLFALWGLFPFLLSVRAGRFADRFDNRLLMICGLSGFAVGLALPYFIRTIWGVCLSAALGGATSMLFVVAAQNLVGTLSNAETRTRNFSYYSLGESCAGIAGPILVGVCIDHIRHPPTFLVLAGIIVLCLALLLARQEQIPNVARHRERGGPARSAKDLLALPALRNALLANGVVMSGLDLFNGYMPVYTHRLGFSGTTIGIIVGAFGAAAVLTRLALPYLTRRWGEHTIMSSALAVAAVAFVAVPFTANAVLLACASFALGLALGCGQPLSMLLSFNAAPPGRSAEAIAMRLAVSYGSHVVLPPIFGALGNALGLAPIFWTCAMLLGGGSALTRPKRS